MAIALGVSLSDAVSDLEAEEDKADDTGQDEELVAIAVEITPTEKGPLPEKTAAMVLEARTFSFGGKPPSEPGEINRHHFWYLLNEDGLTPAPIRDVWNDGLDEELRESLGDCEKVKNSKKGTNRISSAIRRHREKLENATQEA